LPRRPVTRRVVAAARRNIRKAQISRIRLRQPRQLGRMKRPRMPSIRPRVRQILRRRF